MTSKIRLKCSNPKGEKEINQCLRFKESKDRENSTEDNMLYPHLSDPNFNIKIAQKKEFFDTKYDDEISNVQDMSDKLCQYKEFELSPHQRFVRNFLSFQTPYNSLLLFHGLGTGKTCSAILVCEEMRHFQKQMGIPNKIIIVASPNVQSNFKLQLFDQRKLENIEGNWTMKSCTSNGFINEVNPMNMSGFTKDKIIRQINRIINTSYHFMGYTEFSNYIKKKTHDTSGQKKVKMLKRIFSNRLIVIDEVHNIRTTEEKKLKAIIKNLMEVVKHGDNLKLLMLSATPMFNTYKEIIWLLNLMNLNDGRFPIKTNEVFATLGNWKTDENGAEIGKQLLIQKATGYISFVSGENPYTFPYRILPKQFLEKKNLLDPKKYPSKTVDARNILNGIRRLDLVINHIGEYQEKAYYYVIESIKNKYPSFDSIETGLGYQMLEPPLQVLNMAYPSNEFDENGNDSNEILYGKVGLNRIMSKKKKQYTYKKTTLQKYGRIFSEENIGQYSSKINFIIQRIRESEGIVLIYSQYIGGGCVPIALALEEIGFRRYGDVPSLFKKKPVPGNPVSFGFRASYTMITGDVTLSPNNSEAINMVTNDDNINGEKIKVVIISRAASEGIDLKNIRQVHILDPWYNLNRIEQIIGRAQRHCSHKDLPFENRNTEIYMYGTQLTDNLIEAVDLYIYRLAEKKAIKIGKVTRILKENAVDCILNELQTGLTEDKMSQVVSQKLSSGGTIKYNVGSKSFSSICDYMEDCAFTCNPSITLDDDPNMDTYGEDYIIMNLDMITQIIRNLFKEKYYYTKGDLISRINHKKAYPEIQINTALNQLINDKNIYLTDMLNRVGYLVNIGNYYMFQPIEVDNKYITRYDRVHPFDYKQKGLLVKVSKQKDKAKIKHVKKQIRIAVINKMKLIFTQSIKSSEVQKDFKATWYQLCYKVFKGKIGKKYRMSVRFRQNIPKYSVYHFIDSMIYSNKLALLNILSKDTSKKKNTDISYAKEYFNRCKITGKGKLKGLLLCKKKEIIIHILDKKIWRVAKHTEFEKFVEVLKNRRNTIRSNLNNLVGFINSESKDCFLHNCFKTLYIKNQKDRGATCNNKSKKDIVYILNIIINESTGIQKYNLNDKQITDGTQESINQPQLCCELELIMRFYTENKVGGKTWFLSLADAIISDTIK